MVQAPAAGVDDLHDTLVHRIGRSRGAAEVHVEGPEATRRNPGLEADQLSEPHEGGDACGQVPI